MDKPAISVIIPCYNPKLYIKQCVKSVLYQTMTDFEVIVVDDGSTDLANYRSLEQLSKKDSRLRIIRNPHQGLSLTRKDGYLQARGEYIFIIDHDDFLSKDALKKLYDAAISSGADVTIGNYARVADSFGLIRIKRNKPDYDTAGELIQKKDILKVCYGSSVSSVEDPVNMVMWGRLYKSSLIRQALKESEKDLFLSVKYEDWWFNLLLMPYINSLYLTNDIVHYYRYGGCTTTNDWHKGSDAGFFNYRFEAFEKWNFSEGHPRSFACFAAILYEHIKSIILSEKYSKDEIVTFIAEQLSSNKIVDWARNNMAQVESLPQYLKIFIIDTPEDICCWFSNAFHSKRARRHQLLKRYVLACSKVLDRVYQILH